MTERNFTVINDLMLVVIMRFICIVTDCVIVLLLVVYVDT